MEYNIEICDKYIYVRFEKGTVLSINLAREVLTKQRESKEHKVLNDIWDVRSCQPDQGLNSQSIGRIVEYIKELHSPDLYHEKSALIVDSELAYGISRIYQTLAERMPFQIRIFEDDQKAREWILS
jgi:hypothetical protein